MTSLTSDDRLEDRWDLPDVLLVPSDSLAAYFTRIHTIPLLTAEEERHYGLAAQQHDPAAAVRLAMHNLRYAAHCVRRWEDPAPSAGEPVWSLSDAVQAGNIGLWRAVRHYDPAIARFTTYATWWIRQSWDRLRQDFLWQVRLPTHAVQSWRTYQRARHQWVAAHGDEPDAETLAAQLQWPLTRVVFWQQWSADTAHPLSLNGDHDPHRDDPDVLAFSSGLADPHDTVWDRLDAWARQQAVDQLLALLKPREADVLRLRFGIAGAPMTLQEVGTIFHVTRERIRQIEVKALKTLRQEVQGHPEWDLQALLR